MSRGREGDGLRKAILDVDLDLDVDVDGWTDG